MTAWTATAAEPTVVMPTRLVSFLLEHALNTQDGPEDPAYAQGGEKFEPCCASCCAPCGAVMQMAASGLLDQVLAERGPGHGWWDERAGQVDRAWLSERIASVCYSGVYGMRVPCTASEAEQDALSAEAGRRAAAGVPLSRAS